MDNQGALTSSGSSTDKSVSLNDVKKFSVMAQVSNFAYDRDMNTLNKTSATDKTASAVKTGSTFSLNQDMVLDFENDLHTTKPLQSSESSASSNSSEMPTTKDIEDRQSLDPFQTTYIGDGTFVCKDSGLVFSVIKEGGDTEGGKCTLSSGVQLPAKKARVPLCYAA